MHCNLVHSDMASSAGRARGCGAWALGCCAQACLGVLVVVVWPLATVLILLATAAVISPAPPCAQFFADLPPHDYLRRWRGPSLAEGCDDSLTPLIGLVRDHAGNPICGWFPFGYVLH